MSEAAKPPGPFTEARADDLLRSNDWSSWSDARWLLMQAADIGYSHAASIGAAEKAALLAQVRVLREALEKVHDDKSFGCLKIERTQQYVTAALGVVIPAHPGAH